MDESIKSDVIKQLKEVIEKWNSQSEKLKEMLASNEEAIKELEQLELSKFLENNSKDDVISILDGVQKLFDYKTSHRNRINDLLDLRDRDRFLSQ